MRREHVASIAIALALGCASDLPVLSAEERMALANLRYAIEIPPDPSDRVADDPAAQRFGQRLFYDPSLSGQLLEGDNDGTTGTLGLRGQPGRVSCAGCHVPESGFVDSRTRGRQVSLGAQWTLRRAPMLLEAAFASLYNWDGRRDSIWRQAIGVMESNHELNSGRLFVAEQIFRLYRGEYESIFGPMVALDDEARFPPLAPEQAGCVEVLTGSAPRFDCRGLPGDGADYDHMATADQEVVTEVTVNTAKALEAYVRRLRCGPSRFDAWLDGDETALDASEQRGAALFVGRAGCVRCHSGPELSDSNFHNVGLQPRTVAVVILDANDRGAIEGIAAAIADPLDTRGELSDGDRGVLPASVGPELEGAFRTPSLRCVAMRPSFMHTGQLRTLEDVVTFFTRGGDRDGFPGTSEIAPLDLESSERADLVAFLETLTGPGPDASLLGPLSD